MQYATILYECEFVCFKVRPKAYKLLAYITQLWSVRTIIMIIISLYICYFKQQHTAPMTTVTITRTPNYKKKMRKSIDKAHTESVSHRHTHNVEKFARVHDALRTLLSSKLSACGNVRKTHIHRNLILFVFGFLCHHFDHVQSFMRFINDEELSLPHRNHHRTHV